MSLIEYVEFDDIDPKDLLPILNKQTVRAHLMDHPPFTINMVEEWIAGKLIVDQTEGCRVRAIFIDNLLAGWCGIQYEASQYEIAIVLDDQFWGHGKPIFKKLMEWSKQFGHEKVCLHLLSTRPRYKFLTQLSSRVLNTSLYDHQYTTYEISVNEVY